MKDEPLLTPATLPDGLYKARWSGHQLVIESGDHGVYARTRRGVRGINIPVLVTVENEKILEDRIVTCGPSSPADAKGGAS